MLSLLSIFLKPIPRILRVVFLFGVILMMAEAVLAEYIAGATAFTLTGDGLSTTGSFASFEDIKLTFDSGASDIAMSGYSWRPLFLDGGDGVDKITTPQTEYLLLRLLGFTILCFVL